MARKLVERRADLGLLFFHDQIPEALTPGAGQR